MRQRIKKDEKVLKETSIETSFERELDSTFAKLEKIQKNIVKEKISYLEKCLEELELFLETVIDYDKKINQ